ncbi:UNVERIFIED_CONTAM: hypothetical protein GTU68_003225 [Idotea baltica]|nr:hypothetical protein [Idotea baltica]
MQHHLLSLYNQTWNEGQYPSSWKHSILLPLHKPGKKPSLPSSYRPIILLSCVRKLMEKMVHRRLSWWLESHLKLPTSQCEFCPGRSTQDVLIQLEHLIQTNFKDKGVLIMAFMDIQGAFDRALHLGILTKLSDLSIRAGLRSRMVSGLTPTLNPRISRRPTLTPDSSSDSDSDS